MQRTSLTTIAVAVTLVACSAADQSQHAPTGGNVFAGGGASPFGSAGTSVVGGAFGQAGAAPTSGLPATNPLPNVAGVGGVQPPAAAGSPAPAGSTPPAGGAMPPGAAPGNVTPPPAGGTIPPRGAAGAPATPPPAAGAPATPPPAGGSSMEPVVPPVMGECPAFRGGSITYMGLGGIEVVTGPKAASPTAPMLFYWHGTGSFSGEYALMATAVQQGIVSEGGVLVSFQGTTGGDLLSGTAIFGAGDFKLTDGLLACAVKDYNIDAHRVYATGCSAGGLFSIAMATQRSAYMAAAASNSGGWTVPLQFQNKHTPPIMTVHGAAGVDVVIVDFSQTSMTADTGFKGAGGFVINCDHGGGHCGGGGLAGDIWKFFKAHPFGVSPEPWASGLPAGFSPQCKIM